ncbi:MAG: GntR family transcriptional regulator [Hyphomicrobiales bacterium]|nr:GntR family transcriptional regulator [Hyphomicrobiales bacterium]
MTQQTVESIPSQSRPQAHLRPAQPKAGGAPGPEDVYERIYVAILEHRLPPGTKLGEDRMARIFGVSRARIREVLARLAHEGVVELVPQRGARVARPTPEQARDIFEMRRLVEPGVVARLIRDLNPAKLRRLQGHLAEEHDARVRNDKPAVIRLSGEFHNLLAEVAGNDIMARTMRELTSLTCLIIALYDAPTTDACRDDEHAQIVDAIGDKNVDKASRLMVAHLDHIEASLDLSGVGDEVDLERVFAG